MIAHAPGNVSWRRLVRSRGRLFSISAAWMSRCKGDDRHISLKKPLADIA